MDIYRQINVCLDKRISYITYVLYLFEYAHELGKLKLDSQFKVSHEVSPQSAKHHIKHSYVKLENQTIKQFDVFVAFF